MSEKTKTVKLPATVGVPDEENFVPEKLDTLGHQISPAVMPTKHIPAGEPITLPAKLADQPLDRFGGEEVGVGRITPVDPASTEIRRVTPPRRRYGDPL